jgi:hypothetical protein
VATVFTISDADIVSDLNAFSHLQDAAAEKVAAVAAVAAQSSVDDDDVDAGPEMPPEASEEKSILPISHEAEMCGHSKVEGSRRA